MEGVWYLRSLLLSLMFFDSLEPAFGYDERFAAIPSQLDVFRISNNERNLSNIPSSPPVCTIVLASSYLRVNIGPSKQRHLTLNLLPKP